MTDWDMYKCSVCSKKPPYIGTMCKDCWKQAQKITVETLDDERQADSLD